MHYYFLLIFRLIWLAIFCCCFGYYVYTASMRIRYYYSYPVTTRVQVIEQKPLDFPSLTICNFNVFRKSFLQSDAFTAAIAEELDDPETSNLNLSDPALIEKANTYDLLQIARDGSHKVEEMFIKCTWKSREVYCSEVLTPITTSMGLCFTFNSLEHQRVHGPMQVSRPGASQSFTFLVNVQQDDYFLQNGDSAGIKVSEECITSIYGQKLQQYLPQRSSCTKSLYFLWSKIWE